MLCVHFHNRGLYVNQSVDKGNFTNPSVHLVALGCDRSVQSEFQTHCTKQLSVIICAYALWL